MKYVIVEEDGIEVPIIFPDIIKHSTFSALKPVSAGFVNFYGDDGPIENACCCNNAIRVSWQGGGSVSLKLQSREEDEEIIRKELHKHYH